ncbi:MAG: hypothetical protein JNL58_00855 [Planctomyces sp.]|nr:hypothetical protein [Planctomyces sp.]
MKRRLLMIGDRAYPEFSELIAWLHTAKHRIDLVGEFSDLRSTILAGSSAIQSADLIVVLQRWSYQDPVQDVMEFIGQTLGKRVLCVYSRFCDSDGRCHDVWPPVVRVPAALAISTVRSELELLDNGLPVPPVTSAPEEVFSARCNMSLWPALPTGREVSCGVACDDSVLRQTICQGFKLCGWRSSGFSVSRVRIEEFQKCHRSGLLLVDLDVPDGVLNHEVEPVEVRPGFRRAGFSSIVPFHDMTVCERLHLQAVVSSMDLLHGVLRHPVIRMTGDALV